MRKLLILLLLSVCTGMAQAASFGIGTGTSTLDVDTSGADRVDDEDGYLKVFGAAEVSPNLDVEFGYIDFGEFSAHYPDFDETDTASATAFTVSALLNADLTPSLNAYLRVGLDFWNAEFKAAGSDPFFGSFSGSGDGSGNDTYLGAGVDLSLSPKAKIRLELEKYTNIAEGVAVSVEDVGSIELEGSDVDLFGVALIINLE
jgi:hypothetical protein